LKNGSSINTDGTYRIDNQEAFAEAGLIGHGVEARCGFNTASCLVNDGKIVDVIFTTYLNSRGTGNSIFDGTNSPVVKVYGDMVNLKYDKTFMGIHRALLGAFGVNSFTITLEGNASNNWGDQAYARKSWTYTLGPYGIFGP
jgi:hypothetical protein